MNMIKGVNNVINFRSKALKGKVKWIFRSNTVIVSGVKIRYANELHAQSFICIRGDEETRM